MKKSLKCTPFGTKFKKNCVGFWGSAPYPVGGAHDAPPSPLVGRGFLPSGIAASRLRRLQYLELGGSIAGNQLDRGCTSDTLPQPISSGDATDYNTLSHIYYQQLSLKFNI